MKRKTIIRSHNADILMSYVNGVYTAQLFDFLITCQGFHNVAECIGNFLLIIFNNQDNYGENTCLNSAACQPLTNTAK